MNPDETNEVPNERYWCRKCDTAYTHEECDYMPMGNGINLCPHCKERVWYYDGYAIKKFIELNTLKLSIALDKKNSGDIVYVDDAILRRAFLNCLYRGSVITQTTPDQKDRKVKYDAWIEREISRIIKPIQSTLD